MAGIDRHLEGDRTLAEIVAATAATPQALASLRGARQGFARIRLIEEELRAGDAARVKS